MICRCTSVESLLIDADSLRHRKAARYIPSRQLIFEGNLSQLTFTDIDLEPVDPGFDPLSSKFL